METLASPSRHYFLLTFRKAKIEEATLNSVFTREMEVCPLVVVINSRQLSPVLAS